MTFATRYGPWAVIAGASEGTGAAYARLLAAQGLSLVLIARRSGPLEALAEELRASTGVACLAATIDLAQPDAAAQVIAAVGDREVGLYISNAGAVPHGSRFLDEDIASWTGLVNRNVVTVMQCCHHFGGLMRTRGRGGVLLVNSSACDGGGGVLAVYSASKAFDLNFAESLWSELKPFGVDVLSLIMGMTDTPAFNTLLHEKGLPLPPGTAAPEAVAAFGLHQLGNGPVQNWGQGEDESGGATTSAADRRARIAAIDGMSRHVFGE